MDVAQRGDRARILHDLLDTPGWHELHTVFAEQVERYMKLQANNFLRGTAEIDQRDVDYHRGYFDAWRSILAAPEQAEKRFDQALRKKGTE